MEEHGDAEMKMFNNIINTNFNFKSKEKNTTHRRMQMIRVLPVAVALSIAQPQTRPSKLQTDTFDIKNIKLTNEPDYIAKRDGTSINSPYYYPSNEISKKYELLLKKFKQEQTKARALALGTYGRVNTKLNVSKTRYDGRADIFNKYFEGGVLEGKGKKLIELQDKYGINALFLAAVTLVESGGGKSKAAKTKNNVAGIMTRQNGKYVIKKFNNVDECLEYLAKNISKNYINKNIETIENINKKYAESHSWADNIVYHINKMIRDAKV